VPVLVLVLDLRYSYLKLQLVYSKYLCCSAVHVCKSNLRFPSQWLVRPSTHNVTDSPCHVTPIKVMGIAAQVWACLRKTWLQAGYMKYTDTRAADIGVCGSKYTASSLVASEVSCRKRHSVWTHQPRTAGVGVAASAKLKVKTLQPANNCIVSKTKNLWSHPPTYTSHAAISDVFKDYQPQPTCCPGCTVHSHCLALTGRQYAVVYRPPTVLFPPLTPYHDALLKRHHVLYITPAPVLHAGPQAAI